MLLFVVLVSIFTLPINGELPTELDAFLEKLFDTSECEDFLSSGDFLSVATVECAPFTCDFPRQLCMRPADKYQDKGANVCKDLPTECVTAANGGVPLGPSLGPKGTLTLPGIPAPPSPSMVTLPPFPGLGPAPPVPGVPHPNKVINPNNVRPRDICEMGPPTGRFCGFTQKFVYNKDTGDCDEFWFPGCKTEETNANIFDTRRQCERIAEICAQLSTPPPLDPSICFLSKDIGHRDCKDSQWSHRFFFDSTVHLCRDFWYQGCAGNLNNFHSIDHCENLCMVTLTENELNV